MMLARSMKKILRIKKIGVSRSLRMHTYTQADGQHDFIMRPAIYFRFQYSQHAAIPAKCNYAFAAYIELARILVLKMGRGQLGSVYLDYLA